MERLFSLLLTTLFAAIIPLSSQVYDNGTRGLDPRKAIRQYIHEAWQAKDGLPENSAQSIAQTPDGYLWFTTQEGLVRFDGAHFTVFDKNNSALPENLLHSIVTDHSGNLWIASRGGGIVRLQNGHFTTFAAKEGLSSAFTPENSRGLAVGNDNSLWIATLGGGVNRLKDGHVTVFSTEQGLSNNEVNTLFLGNDTTLWIGTAKGLHRLNIRTGTITTTTTKDGLVNDAVQAITQDAEGALWIGTVNGLQCLKDGVWTNFTGKNILAASNINALLYDKAGMLWIGTLGAGVYRLAGGVLSSFTAQEGLTHNYIRDLFEDSEGSLYIGTSGGGINRLRNSSVTAYSLGIGLTDMWSIMEDKAGTMWFSTVSNGVKAIGVKAIHTATETIDHYTTKNGMPSDNAHAMYQDTDGSVWLGTRDKGMCHVVAGKIVKRYGVNDGLPNGRVRVFLRDRRGRLWIGTDKGVSCYHNNVFTNYGKREGLSDGRTTVLYEDNKGNLWIGTPEGLFVFRDDRVVKSYTTKDGMTGELITCLYEDKEHVFWVGTSQRGLQRIENGTITSYTTKNGLFDDMIYSVLEDGSGWLWMSCNKGIFRVQKSALKEMADGKRTHIFCVVYGTRDGMVSAECNGGSQPTAYKTKDGRLWFPTIAGAVVIDPNNLVKNTLPPTVIVEEVFADGRRVGGTSPCKLADSNGVQPAMAGKASFPDTILGEFPATTEKFEINYTATCLTASERVKFKFMMEGYDKEWVEAGNRRTAYYNNLPRGRSLRFRVIACNNDGVWNETGAFAEFRITPFWWETWWFNGLFVFLVAGTIYQGYRWRTRRLRIKAQELERLVEVRTREVQEQATQIQLANTELSESNVLLQHLHKEKNEFLGIAAHDLKNPLAQIILSSGTMTRYYERMSDTDIQEHIQRIGLVAVRMREIISNLLDINALEQGGIRIVLHPFDITPKVHAVVQDYAERAAEKQLRFSTKMEGNLPLVNADETLMVQVLDNLVSNAVKYSPPNKNIFLRLKFTTDAVRLEIQDEGPGFSEEDKEKLFGKFARLSARPTGGEHSTGLGLSIVKKMVEAMNGRVWCESELGNGATFIVELPSTA